MSEMATLLGLPRTFEFEGVTYPLPGVRDFETEALYELWLESEARAAIERHRRTMRPAEYDQHLTGWRRDCAAHVYAIEAPEGVLSLASPPGQKRLAFLMLVRLDKDGK